LIKDFLNLEIPQFSSYQFSLQNALSKAEEKSKSFSQDQRNILVEVFNRQLNSLQLTDKQKNNINLLSQENTFTVTTGHQLNLFSGPAFLFIKFYKPSKRQNFSVKIQTKISFLFLDGNRRSRF
jgi:uncharacterized protein YllA (UPF0747 family)